MNYAKAALGLVGAMVIAGWTAYAVSAPRNFENAMADPVAALDGTSIGADIKRAQNEARAEQCATFKDLAADEWERSLDNGTTDSRTSNMDHLDRQVERFCN